MSDPRTLEVYNTRAEDYATRFDSNTPSKHLLNFISKLPSNGSILDLGCGTGGTAAHLVNSGFSVIATDASSEMLKHARKKSTATFFQATFGELKTIGEFDGIWANFSLLHAPREDMPTHLEAIYRALKPLGYFHIGMKTGVGYARDSIDRYYTYYSQTELRDYLNSAGFDIHQISTGSESGLAGDVEPWIVFLTQRAD